MPRKLLRAVRAEAKARQVSMTEIAEWALTEYLRGTNPELAEEATGRAVPA